MTDKKQSSNLDRWLKKNISQGSKSAAAENSKTPKKGGKSKFFRFGSKSRQNKKHLKILFLGGLNEIGGKNMMALEYDNDIMVIDMGLQFPEAEMLGIDYVVPDASYLEQNVNKIRGVVITHGHLDHIGAISYLAPKLNNPPFFGTKLSMGFVESKLKEYKLHKKVNTNVIEPKQVFKLGVFKVTLFRVNHSIPDSTGVIIETPDGLVVHTGDFKFDFTPADGIMADLDVIESLGNKNVTLMMSDSTNSMKSGKTISEKIVGDSLDDIVREANGRLIIATFSSLIGRMQQILNAAKKYDREVFLSGRSMVQNFKIATKLGFLNYPKGMVSELKKAKKRAYSKKALILSTGSQGESLAALTRMALNSHPDVKITKDDTVCFSSSPIPGNEEALMIVMNALSKTGANIITNKHLDVHTSGHGYSEELSMMLSMVKPKYFVPVHGQYYHRKVHGDIAIGTGVKPNHVFLLENGNILNIRNGTAEVAKKKLPDNYVMVDNQTNMLCGVAHNVVATRNAMSKNGVIILHAIIDKKTKKLVSMDVQSHGFIFMRITKKVLQELLDETKVQYNLQYKKKRIQNTEMVELLIKNIADRQILNRLQRKPVVIPVVTMV